MPLSQGNRLGPYEIIAPLGAGGMGEVYRARDTRLERTVAIKVLPALLAGDPEFKARFEREAKSISALNHPHICTLYDVGQSDDTSFLVMEHLEGETLADRLLRGPVPGDEALDLASQIADALDKAHRQGIVHRDLKPANVFLVRAVGASGTPHCKLLDFGLAKMGVAAPPGSVETRLLPTLAGTAQAAGAPPLTAQGSILGTFQYMAPEQIEGGEADARADIWAFGCVLYEMLTGKRAFEGKTQASLIASILERQPTPMAELQPLTPPALGRLVRTCLEKNPDNRFHTAHDLWLHLQWIEEGGSAAGLPAPVVAGRRRRDRLTWAGGAMLLAALAALAAWWLKPPPVVTNVPARFSYTLSEGIEFSRTGRQNLAVSPDGTMIAFTANDQIYIRRMGELEAQPVRGTNVDPLDLVFSPDSQSIAFFAPVTPRGDVNSSILKKVAVSGGAPVALCPTKGPYGMHWSGDRIVFGQGSSILSVAATGGTPETLVTVAKDSGETLSRPQLVNGGRDLIYTVRPRGGQFDDGQVVIQPAGGGARRVLIQGGSDGRLVSTGHLLWVHDSTLFAQPATAAAELSGGPVPVLEGVQTTATTGAGKFAVANNGTIVFVPGSGDAMSELVWVDRQGREERVGAPPHQYGYPRISPDGTRVAADGADGERDIWIWDIARKSMSRLTSTPDQDIYPVWTPDSRQVIFRSDAGGQTDLFRRMADGTGTLEQLTNTPAADTPHAVLPDGRVLHSAWEGVPFAQILAPSGDGKSARVIPSVSAQQINAEVSPDGRWIAYQSPEGSTLDEVHVRPFPNTDGGHWQISSGGGRLPMWSKNSRELFYLTRNPVGRLMVVPVQTSPGRADFVYGTATEALDASRWRGGAVGRPFDIAPDGQRFLVVIPLTAATAERPTITVITSWFDELRERATGK